MRIAIAQLKLHVGNIVKNKNKLIEYIRNAENAHQAELIIFLELAITSYQPDDLLLRPSLHRQVKKL